MILHGLALNTVFIKMERKEKRCCQLAFPYLGTKLRIKVFSQIRADMNS